EEEAWRSRGRVAHSNGIRRWLQTLLRDLTMNWSFTLAQKGFIIVGVPLLFELILLISMSYMLGQAEHAIETESRARKIASILNRYQTISANNLAAVTGYFLGRSGDLQQYEKGKLLVAGSFEELQALGPGSPLEQQSLTRLREMSDQLTRDFDAIVNQLHEHNVGASVTMFRQM